MRKTHFPGKVSLILIFILVAMAILFIILISYFNTNAFADSSHSSINDHETIPSEKKIVQILENNIFPIETILTRSDSTVFFFNDNEKNPVKIKIEVKGKTLHCASSNLTFKDGFLESEQILPADFAAACFPEAGQYYFEVLLPSGKSFKGEIKAKF